MPPAQEAAQTKTPPENHGQPLESLRKKRGEKACLEGENKNYATSSTHTQKTQNTHPRTWLSHFAIFIYAQKKRHAIDWLKNQDRASRFSLPILGVSVRGSIPPRGDSDASPVAELQRAGEPKKKKTWKQLTHARGTTF